MSGNHATGGAVLQNYITSSVRALFILEFHVAEISVYKLGVLRGKCG